jgi:pantoate--beta-alanine ligase
MKILNSIESFITYRAQLKTNDIGFVATMGALHQGHLSLVKRSLIDNKNTIVSIFINPTQFDKTNDLDNYPNLLEQDLDLLSKAGVDAVFIPEYQTIYPDNYAFQVQEKQFSKQFCGAHRAGHFDGVLTVVMKLFNIIQPHTAYFGEKDYQQLTLIRNMTNAFFMSVNIVGCEIIREKDGLAMSSRNLRLSKQQRQIAPELHRVISSGINIHHMKKELTAIGFLVDYIEITNNRLLVAAYLGEIRLIDNVDYISTNEKAA